MSTIEYELKIETHVLKVHINCQGCVNKVRKVLRKIKGVYEVTINAEEQKAIVTGIVNPSTLIQKLAKLGKHAELLSASYNQEHENYDEGNNHNQENMINDSNSSENQYMIPNFFGSKDHWKHVNEHLVAPTPLFYESVNNITNQNFTGIDENRRWQESMIRMMWPQENNASNFSFGSQEWPHGDIGVSLINEYGSQLYPASANIQGYYHNFQPSNIGYCHNLQPSNIQGYYHNLQPSNIMQLPSYKRTQEGTRNGVMMNAYMIN